MDLTAAISGMQQSAVMGKVQIAVAKKLLEVQQLQGNAAVQLIQAAGKSCCTAGDALTAAATGLGGQLDVTG